MHNQGVTTMHPHQENTTPDLSTLGTPDITLQYPIPDSEYDAILEVWYDDTNNRTYALVNDTSSGPNNGDVDSYIGMVPAETIKAEWLASWKEFLATENSNLD
jgi:hypothetical protein